MKEELRRLARGSLVYGIGNAAIQLTQLLLLPVFTRYLTPADYGTLSVLLLLSTVLVAIFSLGTGTSFGICYAPDLESGRDTTASTIVLLLVSCGAMLAVGVPSAGYVSQLLFHGDQFSYLVIVTLLATVCEMIVTPLRLKLQFDERPKAFVVATYVSAVGSIAVSVMFVIVLGRGLQGMVEGGCLGRALSLLIFALFCFREMRWKPDVRSCVELLRHGLPMIPSFFSVYVLQQGNVYMLQHTMSLWAVGLYSIGYSCGSGISLFVFAVTTAWTPFFLSFRGREEEARTLFGKVLTYYVLGLGMISLLFYAFARAVVTVMTRPEFIGAYKVVGLSATAQVLIGMFSLLLPAVYFAKEVGVTALLQLIAALLFAGVSYVLCRAFAIEGAGVSLVVGYGIMNALLCVWNWSQRRRYLRVDYDGWRLFCFALLYVGYVWFALSDRGLSVALDCVVSCAVWCLCAVVVYRLLLTASERQAIVDQVARVLSRREAPNLMRL